jgi:CrcB protein
VTVLLVALGAAVGAPLRYFTDRSVQARHDSVFPWGTLAVNVVGSLLLGFILGGASAGGVSAAVVAGCGTGFCGALTTYSTFGYETVRLGEGGSWLYGFANIVASLAAGLAAAWLGVWIAGVLWG